MNILLPAVDLRSNIDSVYSQNPSATCFPHSGIAALETMCDRAGQSKRFSVSALYAHGMRKANRTAYQGGLDGSHMMAALSDDGILLASDFPWAPQ